MVYKYTSRKPNDADIEQSKIEFLLIHEGYLASLRREGVSLEDSGTESVYRDGIKFMSALTLDGVGEKFQVLRKFPKARLILYHRKYQNWSFKWTYSCG